MCTLSLIHGEPNLAKTVLTNIALLNACDGNKDGFGVFCVEKKETWKYPGDADKIILSNDFLAVLDNMCDGLKKVTFLVHTRAASFGFKVINTDNTHPFFINNVSLMHNGTLEPKDDNLKIKEKIDSFWFLNHLTNKLGKQVLTAKYIAETYEDFSGRFAFLIYDHKQDNQVFVIKGKMTDLFRATICDEAGKELCFVINTDDDNLVSMIFPHFMRTLGLPTIKISQPEKLNDNSIYTFNIISGKLQRCKTEITERVITTTAWSSRSWYPQSSRATQQVVGITGKIATLSFEMNLSFSELNYLYYLSTGDTILSADYKDLSYFYSIFAPMKALYGTNKGEKKLAVWTGIKKLFFDENKSKNITCLDIYDTNKLQFPWFLNSKRTLKSVSSRL